MTSALDTFQDVRPRLFGIAYRILGSVGEAEDVVQEAWLRWDAAEGVRDPGAWLATVVTRLALNVATSARVQRQTYLGPWLPEPVDTSADPALGAERAEALDLALLTLLERLTPTERAAYVLREAFDYPYDRVADVLETSAVNARQLVSRARAHVAGERRTPVSVGEQRRLLLAFLDASRAGDLAGLERLLVEGATVATDGGGVVSAARHVILGATRVARFMAGIADKLLLATPRLISVNGQWAAVVGRTDGIPMLVSDDGIAQVMIMMNPKMLSHLPGFAGLP